MKLSELITNEQVKKHEKCILKKLQAMIVKIKNGEDYISTLNSEIYEICLLIESIKVWKEKKNERSN